MGVVQLEDQYHGQTQVLESLYQQIQYIAELTNEFKMQSTDMLENSYIVNDDVNIHDLLGMMVKKWSYLYSMHDMELIYSPINKDLIWTSNDLWLQRLFDNIFQNTLQHSKAKKLVVTIENSVVFIRDNGIGFDMNEKSTGLGLKIIEDISRLLNIKYTLQSNKDGTIFCFTAIEKNI